MYDRLREALPADENRLHPNVRWIAPRREPPEDVSLIERHEVSVTPAHGLRHRDAFVGPSAGDPAVAGGGAQRRLHRLIPMLVLLALVLVAGCAGDASTDTSEPVGTGEPVSTEPVPTGEPVPTVELELTAQEIATLTGDSQVEVPDDAPPPVITAEEAEAFVRQRFPGERQTLAVVRIAMRPKNTTQVGWFVGLTPAAGIGCSFNPGFLDRPTEGGIVSDQLLDIIWIFGCPESL